MMSLMARRTWPPMPAPLCPPLVSAASSLGLLSADEMGPRLPRTMFSSCCTGLKACGAGQMQEFWDKVVLRIDSRCRVAASMWAPNKATSRLWSSNAMRAGCLSTCLLQCHQAKLLGAKVRAVAATSVTEGIDSSAVLRCAHLCWVFVGHLLLLGARLPATTQRRLQAPKAESELRQVASESKWVANLTSSLWSVACNICVTKPQGGAQPLQNETVYKSKSKCRTEHCAPAARQ